MLQISPEIHLLLQSLEKNWTLTQVAGTNNERSQVPNKVIKDTVLVIKNGLNSATLSRDWGPLDPKANGFPMKNRDWNHRITRRYLLSGGGISDLIFDR